MTAGSPAGSKGWQARGDVQPGLAGRLNVAPRGRHGWKNTTRARGLASGIAGERGRMEGWGGRGAGRCGGGGPTGDGGGAGRRMEAAQPVGATGGRAGPGQGGRAARIAEARCAEGSRRLPDFAQARSGGSRAPPDFAQARSGGSRAPPNFAQARSGGSRTPLDFPQARSGGSGTPPEFPQTRSEHSLGECGMVGLGRDLDVIGEEKNGPERADGAAPEVTGLRLGSGWPGWGRGFRRPRWRFGRGGGWRGGLWRRGRCSRRGGGGL